MIPIATAYHTDGRCEVAFAGRVLDAPHFFFGTKTQCEHEAFDASTVAGPVEIVDNVGLAPRIPVHPGDRIEVRGEMVHDSDRTEPIVHWTHRDPAGRHIDGFIRVHGETYA